jgi:hypothetical protein
MEYANTRMSLAHSQASDRLGCLERAQPEAWSDRGVSKRFEDATVVIMNSPQKKRPSTMPEKPFFSRGEGKRLCEGRKRLFWLLVTGAA